MLSIDLDEAQLRQRVKSSANQQVEKLIPRLGGRNEDLVRT